MRSNDKLLERKKNHKESKIALAELKTIQDRADLITKKLNDNVEKKLEKISLSI